MLGLKTVGAVGFAATAIGVAAVQGKLGADYLTTLGVTSCFVVGAFAGLATGLVAVGWQPRVKSKVAIGWRDGRLVLELDLGLRAAAARDLPAGAQRALLVAAFLCVGLGVFTNLGTARLVAVPTAVATPSPGEYCRPAAPREAAEPAPPEPPVDIPGCALVKRAHALGYTKTLGSCAPKEATPAVKTALAARAPCDRRQLDEPWLHYAARRLGGAGGAITETNPIDAVGRRVDETRTHLDHLDTILAAQRHAVTGTPHAAHHLFITLPDPDPGSWLGNLVSPPHCEARYAELPLWPPAGAAAPALVDHVLGQLLFAARFGTTASCRDYTIHWSAPADACRRLTADPIGFLAGADALDGVREVLDRRRRAGELRALADALGRKSPPPPPAAASVVSFACLVVDPAAPVAAPATGGWIALDGERLTVRELRVPAIPTGGAAPLAIYAQLADLLAGTAAAPELAALEAPPPAAGELASGDYRLVQLDRLHDADPFRGVTWPLERADLVEVYPLHRHLRGFVDAFRRRYRAQRGRL